MPGSQQIQPLLHSRLTIATDQLPGIPQAQITHSVVGAAGQGFGVKFKLAEFPAPSESCVLSFGALMLVPDGLPVGFE